MPYTSDGTTVHLARTGNFKYLGAMILSTGSDVKTRIGQAWSAVSALTNVWRSPLSRQRKVQLFAVCVATVLTYGSETWTLTKSAIKELASAHGAMLRLALGCNVGITRDAPHVSDFDLYDEFPPLSVQLVERMLRYAGHASRREGHPLSDAVHFSCNAYLAEVSRLTEIPVELLPLVMTDRRQWHDTVEKATHSFAAAEEERLRDKRATQLQAKGISAPLPRRCWSFTDKEKNAREKNAAAHSTATITTTTRAIPLYHSDTCTKIWVDGSCANSVAGFGVFFARGDPRNQALKVPGPGTNNRAELWGILAALRSCGSSAVIAILSDSTLALFALEDATFTENLDLVASIRLELSARTATTLGIKVASHVEKKGHPPLDVHLGNEAADVLADRGAQRGDLPTLAANCGRHNRSPYPAEILFLREGDVGVPTTYAEIRSMRSGL